MRLFVAVDPDEAVRQALAAILEALRPLAPDAKWAKPEGMHLTLAFLGEVADATVPAVKEAVERAARGSAPLHLSAKGGGSFGARSHPRVLWVGLEGDVEPLGSLKSTLEAALVPSGYQPDPRPFSPHLTLARSRLPRGDRDLATCAADLALADLGGFVAEELILYRSHLSPKGSRYEVLVRAKLGGG